jgi:hypothetical protein
LAALSETEPREPHEQPPPSRLALIRDIGINAGAPYATYLTLRAYDVAVVPALAAGAIFPVTAIIVGFVRKRRVDALGMIILVATAASILGSMLLTSPYLLLAKGSLLTSGVGTLFLLSLMARRPLIFYLASTTGQDAAGRAEYEQMWQDEPRYRWVMRRLTLVWGLGLYCEAALRLVLIPLLPIAVFLPISEALWIAFFLALGAWSWRFGARHVAELEETDKPQDPVA